MVTAVVLAAGAGRRMGGRPKALLERGGRTFLERVAAACRDGGCGRIVVVVRPGIAELTAAAEGLGADVVENPEPERGMFSSVLLGLEAALAGDPPADAVLVFPVDHPDVASGTVAALVTALRDRTHAAWAQPEHAGRGGHPILLRRGTARTVLDHGPSGTLGDALRDDPALRIPVADPAVIRNLNHPKDLD